MEKNCYQREHDARNGNLQQGNYALISNQGDEQLFVMQHIANSMIGGVIDNNVWYVDFGASNHITSHGKWFRNVKDLKTLHIPSHKLARFHCPCKMSKQNT